MNRLRKVRKVYTYVRVFCVYVWNAAAVVIS